MTGWGTGRGSSLATKLRAILVLVAVSVTAVAGIGYARLMTFERRVIDLYDGRVVPLRELKEVSDRHAIDVVDAVHKVCAGQFTPARGEAILSTALREIDDAWRQYCATRATPEDERMIAITTPLLAEARAAVLEGRDLMVRGDVPALERFRQSAMYPRIDPLTARLGDLVEVQMRETDALVRRSRDDTRTARTTSAIALLATGLVALAVGIVASRRLVYSLEAMEAVVRAAASGDLGQRVALRGNDELAKMARDIDEMIAGLERSRKEAEASARALTASEKEARAANAAKSIFLSSMSHELRTPLNVILGYTQLLLRDATRPAAERKELARIREAGDHLLGLIDDVLSIAKIEAGTLILRARPFAPSELLRAVSDMLAPRARAKGLSFEAVCSSDVPGYVAGDESKLRQVLVNLVSNAVKFTAHGEVKVTLDYAKGRLNASVVDTGPGIDASEQARLFEPFVQGAAGTGAAEGTGLGLFITRSLVRLMGGEVSVRSEIGKGTEVSFSIAAETVPSQAILPPRRYEGATLPAGAEIAPMLVIDDRETNRDVLARLLRGLGLRVDEAASGEEGLARWSERPYSIVWMDLRMPGMDGRAALARLRDEETRTGRARTRVVAITASVISFDRDAALRAGFDELVGKPFLADTVFRTLESLLAIQLAATTVDAAPAAPRELADCVTALPPDARERLLSHLVRGEIDDALRDTDVVTDAEARSGLRAIIETFRVDELIERLRASAPSPDRPPA